MVDINDEGIDVLLKRLDEQDYAKIAKDIPEGMNTEAEVLTGVRTLLAQKIQVLINKMNKISTKKE